jgi:hypothetical protein
MFWKIIKKSCFGNSLPENINGINEYEFWPHWDATGTTKSIYVEPDIFIRFKNFDLIIEAKRWDNNQQYQTQWRNEFIGYKNKYREDERDVFLLAIGGINNKEEETINVENYGLLKIVKCRWNRLLDKLLEVLNEMEQCYYINNDNLKRIVYIIISALELHGYIKIKWMNDLVNKYRIDYDSSFSTLNKWRMQNE